MKNSKRSLIINADDFGLTKGVNRAIHELCDAGMVSSTSVMANMPLFKEVTAIRSKIGVGVHLNLTTGQPVLSKDKVSTLVDETGYFFSLKRLLQQVRERRISKRQVEDEFSAQIQKLIQMGLQLDHVNAHQSLLKYPYFFPLIVNIAKQFNIGGVRTYRNRNIQVRQFTHPQKLLKYVYLNYQNWRLRATGFKVADRVDNLLNLNLHQTLAMAHLTLLLETRWKGVLELIVHPGYCHGENACMGDYTYQREVELRALLSAEFRKTIEATSVELISFGQLTELTGSELSRLYRVLNRNGTTG